MPCPPLRRSLLVIALMLTVSPWHGAARAQAAATSLVDEARAAAQANRNREAADLFARAIDAEPDRRGELLQEYADQLTYSERSREAVPLYRERLRVAVAPDERMRLLKGLGLALLWSDRPSEAVAVFEEIVSQDPSDGDAQRNLARALAWSARPRGAAERLEGWLDRTPDDADGHRLMAEIRGWLGQPYLAAEALARTPPDAPQTAALRVRVEEAIAARTRIEFAQSSQSDRLDIQQATVAHEQPLQLGRATLGASVEHIRFQAEDGGREIAVARPLLLARYRLSDRWEVNTRLGVDRVDLDNDRDYSTFVHASWLTWWPSDLLRFDLSASRSTFDNLRSLERGLTARGVGLSVDVTPNERWRGAVRAERTEFSDGNGRDRLQVAAERRLSLPLGAWLGARWTAFEFDRLLDNGYFNPRRLHSPQLTFRMTPRVPDDRRWDVAFESAWGREYADPGEAQPAWELGLIGGIRLSEDWRLQAAWRRFSTRTSALSGFERTTASVMLQGRW